MTIEITEAIATRVLSVVDAGLLSGVGNPKPGEMCVEAAVCYALGLPHGDNPACVSPALRSLKITLNDKGWSSKEARAKGLRRLAVAQLGSAGHINDQEFAKRVAEMTIRKTVPAALRIAASIQKNATHKAALITAANRCEVEGSKAAADAADAADAAADAADAADAAGNAAYAAADAAGNAAYAAADAADAADAAADAADAAGNAAYAAAEGLEAAGEKAKDQVLADFAEEVVQILIAMNAPGCQWLALTEAA